MDQGHHKRLQDRTHTNCAGHTSVARLHDRTPVCYAERTPTHRCLCTTEIKINRVVETCPFAGTADVAEPPELFRLKCASHRYTADTNSTHFKRNNPLVCRVFARYNHGSTGSKQVYLARRRVYNCTQLVNF
jgi:hypothetical protein